MMVLKWSKCSLTHLNRNPFIRIGVDRSSLRTFLEFKRGSWNASPEIEMAWQQIWHCIRHWTLWKTQCGDFWQRCEQCAMAKAKSNLIVLLINLMFRVIVMVQTWVRKLPRRHFFRESHYILNTSTSKKPKTLFVFSALLDSRKTSRRFLFAKEMYFTIKRKSQIIFCKCRKYIFRDCNSTMTAWVRDICADCHDEFSLPNASDLNKCQTTPFYLYKTDTKYNYCTKLQLKKIRQTNSEMLQVQRIK